MPYTKNTYFSDPPITFQPQMKINSTTGSEIITAANVKDFARIDTTADDTIIGQMITQARIVAENYISKDIVAKNRTYYLPFANTRIALPFAPVASISSATVDGTAATYSAKGLDNEIIELNELPAKEVKITYITTGLDDSFLKQALLQMVTTYYDNRSDFVTGTIVQEIKTSTRNLLSSYKTVFI
jgi:hypothetical protein|tara:strand:+ start:621 stop:1178 length:558 start_codon:yes stop_codon:yes gene_type:complete